MIPDLGMKRLSSVTLSLLVAISALAREDGLTLRLELETSHALTGIPVGSELILENSSKVPLSVPLLAYYRVHYLTADEWTVERSSTGPYGVDLRDLITEVIQPDQTVRIPDLPGTNMFSTVIGGEAFLRPGKYTIEVLLSRSGFEIPPASDSQHSAQVAALSSEWVTPAVAFTVEEASGDDALVWARIREVTHGRATLLGHGLRPGEWIRPLVSEHPDSAYVPYLSDYYGLDDRASAEFAGKWLARDLPVSVKEWLSLRRARALSTLTYMDRTDATARALENEALSIATELAKHATVRGLKREAQRIVEDITGRRSE